jgi:dipeptidase E
MQIIAIGGGSLKKGETLAIDKQIVACTGKKHPRALFIPTASNDLPEYCEAFERVYGRKLGCIVDQLLLYRRPKDRKAARQKIYVGGGNTLRMMTLWRRLGIDKLLVAAARKGTVMAGLSAGAICWHDWGHSDSRSYTTKTKHWKYIKVRSLGVVPGLYCPHLDKEKRHHSFAKMVEQERMLGIACDNDAAIWYHDKVATCLATRKTAGVHLYRLQKGRVVVTTYRNQEQIEL